MPPNTAEQAPESHPAVPRRVGLFLALQGVGYMGGGLSLLAFPGYCTALLRLLLGADAATSDASVRQKRNWQRNLARFPCLRLNPCGLPQSQGGGDSVGVLVDDEGDLAAELTSLADDELAMVRFASLFLVSIGFFYLQGGRTHSLHFLAATCLNRGVTVPLAMGLLALLGARQHFCLAFGLLDPLMAMMTYLVLIGCCEACGLLVKVLLPFALLVRVQPASLPAPSFVFGPPPLKGQPLAESCNAHPVACSLVRRRAVSSRAAWRSQAACCTGTTTRWPIGSRHEWGRWWGRLPSAARCSPRRRWCRRASTTGCRRLRRLRRSRSRIPRARRI